MNEFEPVHSFFSGDNVTFMIVAGIVAFLIVFTTIAGMLRIRRDKDNNITLAQIEADARIKTAQVEGESDVRVSQVESAASIEIAKMHTDHARLEAGSKPEES